MLGEPGRVRANTLTPESHRAIVYEALSPRAHFTLLSCALWRHRASLLRYQLGLQIEITVLMLSVIC